MSGQMPPYTSGPYGPYPPESGQPPSRPLYGPYNPGPGQSPIPPYGPYPPGQAQPQSPYGQGSAPSTPLYPPYHPVPTMPQPPRPPQRRGIFSGFAQWWNAGCWQKAVTLCLIPVILMCSCISCGVIYDLTPAGQQQLAASRATDTASTATAVSAAGTQQVQDANATATADAYAKAHPTATSAPTNTPAPHWTTIHHYAGSGDFESDPIDIANGGRIAWSMTPASGQNLNYFSVDIESVTTHQTYSAASEYDSTHVKSGITGGAISDKYYIKVSASGLEKWSVDVQVFQ